MSYCTYEDVGLLLSLTFDETLSKPLASKVTDIISLIASEINMTVVAAGVALPSSGTDFYNVLRLKNMHGAAGVVGVAYYGNTEDVAGSQGVFYRDSYNKFLLDLSENPTNYKNYKNAMVLENQVTDGTYTEESLADVFIGNDWVD